ncbi:hypothetical protein ARMGADRAFT_1062235 [Armillaria gallica]|uniref:Uncharacterized protein n=1 Tax=Armillaria gallica TaxID=47427 RepID=A0A2H3DH86_ARMGA|nr:hypothetical protein ARMGADRAFT_1062235 [Armillaria gallica]
MSSTVYNKKTDIPSDLTDSDKALLFQFLDAQLNSGILYALLYGIYTGILAVTLWNISPISTILADLYMVWCCWMVWGQHWLVVLLPIFSLVSAIISKAMTVYYDQVNIASPLWNIFMMLYISLNLAWSTGIAKGVAPTLLVGQAAAGHTCPRDNSDESTLSSLHFQTPSEPSTTSSQHEESTIQSSVFAVEIEAQPEHS